jgi:hypothetical protein
MVLFRAAKVFQTLQDQRIDMRVHVFAGASPEKHAQKSFFQSRRNIKYMMCFLA